MEPVDGTEGTNEGTMKEQMKEQMKELSKKISDIQLTESSRWLSCIVEKKYLHL